MHALWDLRVVLDLFLGGLGVGAFLFATLLYIVGAQKFQKAIKAGFIASPVLICVGLLLLLTELGRPLNVIKAVFNTNSTSILSIGMFLQGICITLMLLVVVQLFTSKTKEISKALLYVTSTFALAVGFYHGFFLTGIERTAWSDSIPTMLFISSLLSGISLVATFSFNDEGFKSLVAKFKLPAFLAFLIVLQALSVLSWVYVMAHFTAESVLVYNELFNSFSTYFYGFMIVGLVLPLIIFINMLSSNCACKGKFALASICLILGSLTLKYIIVYLGQMV